ncbi:glycoside hydrolase family 3 protein [Jatrophihabitans endophyticus]|uniref:glycoside hydrolase family 3 protein n=1 Tax=Jatrophihabitans endophyticus TaxID=1206085 RepID=UPI0019DC042C|nr:glycoside hydrolase family 3 N-terminal domain-containing protein [Jatrophihabitans endophyticus]MBE7187603.1 glycoside hydrolase family 3 C-terminal domain-containing protein [Jatrophihabitans endophyticus]
MSTPSRFPYQDESLAVEQRVEDLLSRMTLEDKTGLLFHPIATIGDVEAEGLLGTPSMRSLLDKRINHFNILQAPTTRAITEWHNAVQAEVAKTTLGIPVTISSDPRHSFANNPATSFTAGPFSQWPEPLGFAAIGDEALVQRWADIVRREYVAVGIRVALHPQIDLATEPRWARASATFGQDSDVTSRLGVAYIRGLQGKTVGPQSVSAMAKHFPGGGPQKDGEDPHFEYGREQVYPGGQFELHLAPFKAAIAAGVGQMMPYYGMPVGTEFEEVGFSFNKQIVTGLLREQLGFDGIVCTDWGILSRTFWGVEDLSYEDRMFKAFDAGVDQFGGEYAPEVLAGLVRNGRVSQDRLDTSVRRLLREKFLLGLVDRPTVDVAAAEQLVGTPAAREEGLAAQAAAQTLLINRDGAAHLPLNKQLKVYVEGMDPNSLAGRANVVASVEDADVAILRIVAPWEQRTGELDFFFHAGSLDFTPDQVEHIRAIAAAAPTVVDVYLDRPAILTPLQDLPVSLLVNFGSTDEAFVRVAFGEAEPKGRLPFEIPSSMAAVLASRPDVPSDTADPAYPYGAGLDYDDWTPAAAPTDDERAATTVEQKSGPRFDPETVLLGALLDDPQGAAILNSVAPDLSDNPMMEMVRAMPFSTVIAMAGDADPAQIAQLKAAIAAI